MGEITTKERERLHRVEILLGEEKLRRVSNAKVIIFGVGGVGGWCAESLVRSGIRHLTIVDKDTVCITNSNRQIVATNSTIGQAKVDVLRKRLLDINPDADITALHKEYNSETAEEFHIEDYDYVIDAIDSLKDKIHLVCHATNIGSNTDGNEEYAEGNTPTLFSSMGAARRFDPFAVKCAEFWKVRNDALGAMMRKRMRQRNQMPGKKFMCVYSDELPQKSNGEENGTLAHVVAMFGFALSGLVINDITK